MFKQFTGLKPVRLIFNWDRPFTNSTIIIATLPTIQTEGYIKWSIIIGHICNISNLYVYHVKMWGSLFSQFHYLFLYIKPINCFCSILIGNQEPFYQASFFSDFVSHQNQEKLLQLFHACHCHQQKLQFHPSHILSCQRTILHQIAFFLLRINYNTTSIRLCIYYTCS